MGCTISSVVSTLETVCTFPPAPESVPEARGFARAALAEWGVGEIDDVLVVLSELVANAVMHAGTPTTVELRLEAGRLRLDVEDLHPSKPLRMGADAADADETHGRGLVITSALTAAWGVEYRPTSKRVWAELALETTLATVPVESRAEAPVHPGPDPTIVAEGAARPRHELDPDLFGLRASALNRLAIDDLLRLVLEQARERAHADAAYLLLSQGIEDHYVVQATSGLPVRLRHRIVRPGETGAPGRWSQLAPVVVDDLVRDPAPLLAGLPLRGLVVAQVVFEGRVVGALAVASERPGAFTEEDGATLQLIADWVAGAVERARLRAAERERRGWLGFLSDTGELLSESLELDMTVAMIGQIAVPRLATWCGIYLADERGGPRLQHAWHADERRLDALRDALRRTTPSAASDDPTLAGAVTCFPLGARGRTAGWLVLGRETGGPLRGEIRTVAEAFVTRAALAIDNALVHAELRTISQTLQRSLLPDSVPPIPGVDVGVGYVPAGTTTVGGDFYDVFSIGGGRWCFVVGDVCGKGADGAAVTGIARHTIRTMMRSGFAIGTTLDRLNDAILEEGARGRFLTLVCGTFEAGRRSSYDVRLVCAGHPAPFVERDGEVSRVGRPQPLLGVLARVDYEEEQLRLPAGSRIVMVTDGVLERRDGMRMLDDEGVEAELLASGSLAAQGAVERLLRAVETFAETPCIDDVAVLAMDLGSRVTMPTSGPASTTRARTADDGPPPRVGVC